MRISQCNNTLNLLLVFWINDYIDVSPKTTEFEVKYLPDAGSMRMHDALPFFEGDAGEAILVYEVLQKCMVHILGLVNLHILLVL